MHIYVWYLGQDLLCDDLIWVYLTYIPSISMDWTLRGPHKPSCSSAMLVETSWSLILLELCTLSAYEWITTLWMDYNTDLYSLIYVVGVDRWFFLLDMVVCVQGWGGVWVCIPFMCTSWSAFLNMTKAMFASLRDSCITYVDIKSILVQDSR